MAREAQMLDTIFDILIGVAYLALGVAHLRAKRKVRLNHVKTDT